ncbi:MAG: hypothetical protein ABI895_25385 [Deltaproteobacteria bacterium]
MMMGWSRVALGMGLAAAFGLAVSCGAQVQVDAPMGSQTHFLRSCPGGACGDGLVCTCGVCTLPCAQARDCAIASGSASCESAEASCSQARSICSIECNVDSDCASLGDGFSCQQGKCRGEPLLLASAGPTARPRVGDGCLTHEEASPEFGGFNAGEISVSLSHAGCAGVEPDIANSFFASDSDGICITYQFSGRISCPEGQAVPSDGRSCSTPFGEPVTVPVPPQDPARPPSVASYCSCRCGGPSDRGARCRCPAGMACEAVGAPNQPGGADSYCVLPLEVSSGPGSEPEELLPGGAPTLPPPGR